MVSLDLPFWHVGPGGRPIGNGRFQIIDLRWDGEELAPSFRGDLRLWPEELEFRDVSGSLGEGLVRAHLVVPLGRRVPGSFRITLNNVEANRLLVPWPEIAVHVQGLVNATFRGRLGPETYGGGTVELTHGRVAGIDIAEWRLPVKFLFSPREGQGELTVSDANATVAHGRALGRARLTWGAGVRLEGDLRFFDADLRTLLASSGEPTTLAAGRVNGRVEFGASEMRSLDDLNATFSATLHQAQALQMPVLRQLTPFLRSGMSAATFQSGEIEARLARGVVRLQRLTLQGGILQMIVQGTLTLAGRLNLEVTARTGKLSLLPPGLRLLRIPAAGAMPLSLVAEASFLLASSVVHLRVTGTVHNPIIQVEPLRLLSEDAVRFFLSPVLLLSP